MGERIRRLGERWPWLGRTLELVHRVDDLDGRYAASAITLNVFLSLFPLLLVIISIVGLVTGSNQQLGERLITNLGLTGQTADQVRSTLTAAQRSARAGSIIGLIGLAWTGLNVVGSIQHGVNLPWGVQVKNFKARLMGVPWLAGAGAIFIGSLMLGAVIHLLPDWAAPLTVVAGLAVNLALFVWTFWLLGNVKVGIRDLLPGAILGAIGFEILKAAGTLLLPALVASSSAIYGSLGVVFVIIAWLLLFGRLLIFASVLNVLVYERREGAAPGAEAHPAPID